MTEEQYAEIQRRGRGALGLLEGEEWREVTANLRAEIHAEWAATALANAEGREQRFAELKGLEAIEQRLAAWVDNAKYEAAQREKRRRA